MELLFKHMGTSSIMDLMHNLVTLIEGPELKQSLRGVCLSNAKLFCYAWGKRNSISSLIVYSFALVAAKSECDTKFSEFITSERWCRMSSERCICALQHYSETARECSRPEWKTGVWSYFEFTRIVSSIMLFEKLCGFLVKKMLVTLSNLIPSINFHEELHRQLELDNMKRIIWWMNFCG